MADTGLDTFDRTVQKSNEWLRDLAEIMHTEERHQAYSALRATLHALRDRLTVDQAAHLGAQLPMLIRGIYYEGYKPADKPLKLRDRDSFIERVEEELRGTDQDNRAAVTLIGNVFELLDREMPQGELAQVREALPEDVRDLWPAVPR